MTVPVFEVYQCHVCKDPAEVVIRGTLPGGQVLTITTEAGTPVRSCLKHVMRLMGRLGALPGCPPKLSAVPLYAAAMTTPQPEQTDQPALVEAVGQDTADHAGDAAVGTADPDPQAVTDPADPNWVDPAPAATAHDVPVPEVDGDQ